MKTSPPSDSFFKTFVHQCNDLVVITDKDANIAYVNPAFEKHTGYQLKKIRGQNISLVKSGLHNKTFYEKLWTKLKAGNPASFVFINKKKNGELYYENKTITPIKDEKNSISYYLSTSKDVTNELNLQRELVKQKNLIQSVIQNTDALIIGLDDKARIILFNKAAEKISGYNTENLNGKEILHLTEKNEKAKVKEIFSRNNFNVKKTFKCEFSLKPKRGKKRLISWSITLLPDDRIKPGIVLATGIDITNERESENKLRELNTMLDKKVRQKTERLNRLNEKITIQNNFISKINSELPALVYLIDLKKESIRFFNNRVSKSVIIPQDKNKSLPLGKFLDYIMLEKNAAREIFTRANQETELPFLINDTHYLFENRSIVFESNSNNEPLSILGFISDITKTRFIQTRLEESQKIARIGTWEWNITNDNLYWSNEIYRIFDLSPEEFQPSYPKFIGAIHPSDRTMVQEAVKFSVTNKVPYEIIHRVTTPSGIIKHVKEKGYAEYSGNGTPLRMIGTVQDITEELTLREDLKSAYVTLQNSLNAVITCDLEGKILFANDAAIKMWGFESLTKMKTEERFFSGFLPEQFTATFSDGKSLLMEKGAYYSPEPFITRKKSGEKMFVKFNLSVIKNSSGSPYAITGAFFDVTSQVETEKKIKEYDNKINRLLENIDEVVFGIDAKSGSYTGGKLFFLSARSKELMGFTHAELIEQPNLWLNSVHGEDLENILQSNLKTILDKTTITRNYRLQHYITGDYRWFEEKITPHFDEDGNLVSFYGSARDVTERIHSELLLRESEEKYRSLFQNILVGILRVNVRDMKPLEANDLVINLFGFDNKEQFYRDFVFSDYPTEAYKVDDMIYDLKNNSTLTNQKIKFRKRNPDEEFWGQINARLVANEKTLELVILDVSENHSYEEQLRKNILEKEVLLKEVHHRVKNNLQIICSLLRLQLLKIDNPVIRQPLVEGYERIHGIALIHEKLYLSEDLTTINFSEYLVSLIKTMVNLNPEKEIRTCFNTEKFATDINTAIPLGLMCFEIVSNSFKHAYRETTDNTLNIKVEKKDDLTELSFQDSGEGFDTRSIVTEKTLGWKLIKNLALQAKANVQIESEKNKGTTITIKGGIMRQRNKIMIVEDEAVIAMDIISSVEQNGFEVSAHLTRGEDVIPELKRSRPDLVLMDIKLAGSVDGVEVAGIIHENYDIPVIFITSYSNTQILNRAKKTNPFGYLIKPFNERELLNTIEIAFYKHETEQRLRESERKYRELSESIQQIILECDLSGKINYLNQPGIQLLGLSQKDYDSGAFLGDFLGGTSFELLKKRILEHSSREGQGGNREYLLINRYGKHYFIEEYLSPLHKEGVVAGLRGILFDISSRRMKRTLNMLTGSISQLFNDEATNVTDIIQYLLTEFKTQFLYLEDVYYNEKLTNGSIRTYRPSHISLRSAMPGHTEYILEHKRPLYLRGDNLIEFNKKHSINIQGSQAICWAGFPVEYENRVIGVFSLQSFKNENALTSSDFENLVTFFNSINSHLARLSHLKFVKRSESEYKHLVNSLSEGIIQTNRKGDITFVNKQFTSITGYSAREVVGNNIFRSLAIEQKAKERIQAKMFNRTKKRESTYEVQIIHRKGIIKHLLVNARPFKNHEGRITGSLATIVDVTEKKENLRRIEVTEQRFKAIFDQAGVGVAIVNSITGQILEVNKKYCEIFGFNKAELKSMSWKDFSYSEDIEPDMQMMDKLLRNEIREFTLEKRHIRKNGEIVWINLTVSGLLTCGEDTRNHLAIVHNITKRKEMESALLRNEIEKENILRAIPDSFVTINTVGIIENSYIKDTEKILKTSKKENINGLLVEAALYPGLKTKLRNFISSVHTQNNVSIKELKIKTGAETLYFELRFIKLNDDNILMIIRNVTDYKKNLLEVAKFFNITEQTK